MLGGCADDGGMRAMVEYVFGLAYDSGSRGSCPHAGQLRIGALDRAQCRNRTLDHVGHQIHSRVRFEHLQCVNAGAQSCGQCDAGIFRTACSCGTVGGKKEIRVHEVSPPGGARCSLKYGLVPTNVC